MRRMVVVFCPTCQTHSERICDEAEVVYHTCGSVMEQRWWMRTPQRATMWNKDEMAVVFRKSDGQGSPEVPLYRFPMRNDAPVPQGYERVEVRSDQQMAKVEQEAGVRSERRWYDRGSGGGHEKELPSIPRRM